MTKGFSLIEVLVTVVILAIGLLGMARLQTITIKEAVDSDQRAQAVFLINGLIDRMRANVEGQLNGYTAVDASLCTKPAKMCSDYLLNETTKTAAETDCSADEMAEFDVWELICGFDRPDIISGAIDQLILTGNELILVCEDNDITDTNDCSVGSDFTVSLSWYSVAKDAASSDDVITAQTAQTASFVVRP